MNKIILLGYVGRDPEVRMTQGGLKIVKLGLGVSETYKGKKETTWFNLTCFGKTGDYVETYVKKGSQVLVEGKMKQSTYTGKDGVEKKAWDVIVSNLQGVGPKEESAAVQGAKNVHQASFDELDDGLPF